MAHPGHRPQRPVTLSDHLHIGSQVDDVGEAVAVDERAHGLDGEVLQVVRTQQPVRLDDIARLGGQPTEVAHVDDPRELDPVR